MNAPMRCGVSGVVLGGLLLVAGCGRHEDVPAASVMTPRPAAIETVAPATIPDLVEAVGTVRSRAQSVLSSKIVAAVVTVHAREGQRVEAGQALVELDDRDVRAQLDRARAAQHEARSGLEEVERSIEGAERAVESATAQADLARVTHDRVKELVDRELVARQDHDEAVSRLRVANAEAARAGEAKAALLARRRQAEARIEQARADVDNATIVVGYTRIAAPASGIVVARTVEAGNLAAPGVPLMTIDVEHYRLEASVRESDVHRLHPGQRAEVALDAMGRVVSGPIVEIVPAADPLSRTFMVKIELPPTPGLRTGLYGRAIFAVGTRQALTVPRTAVAMQGQLENVFVVDAGDVARLRLVKTGKAHGERVEMLSGISVGDRVVIDPALVSDGLKIEAVR